MQKRHIIAAALLLGALGYVFCQENQWQDFDWQEVGITASEFEKVKNSGMSKAELLDMIEIGIMPEEYFSEPWKNLGVSKSEWLSSKRKGLEDADIDRTIYTRSRVNFIPVVSFFLPGYYQYKTERYKYGGVLTGGFLAAVALTFLHQEETNTNTTDEPEKSFIPIYPILAVVAMSWSAADAFIGTRYQTNREAERFSLNLFPGSQLGAQVSLQF